uniref:RHS repeat-associated core domain-containing protein n=1 Tax=Chamaesiphon sp. OTE_75_metabat_556 TaxID=2964692 RepID=UPI00286C90AB
QTSSIELKFAYTGREWDGETGQYYYRARYYDAAVGRFISEDPIGFNASDGNLSRYVGNSTTNFIDPSGYAPVLDRPPVTTPITPTVSGAQSFGSKALNFGGKVLNLGSKLLRVGGPVLDILLNPSPVSDGTIRRSPKPTALKGPTAPEKYGPPEPSIPIEKMTEREVQRMLDKRFQDIQRNNPKHQDPKRVVITKTIVVTEEQLEAERTESPDPNCPEAKRREECKKQGRRILYRGDSRSPNDDNIFFDGFKVDPENTMDDFVRHVNENPANTIFISTSQKESVAIEFAVDRGKRNGYLYEICDPGNGRSAQKEVYNRREYKGRHEFRDQAEIAFEYEIPGRYIIKSTYYSRNRKPGSNILNPGYNPYPYPYIR